MQVSLHSEAFRTICEQTAVELHAFQSEDRKELKDWMRKSQQPTLQGIGWNNDAIDLFMFRQFTKNL
jgi:hypothetical protein